MTMDESTQNIDLTKAQRIDTRVYGTAAVGGTTRLDGAPETRVEPER